MPKKVCNVLNTVLMLSVLAVVIPPVHFAQSPSGKEASSSLSTQPNQSNPQESTLQNASTPAQDIGLISALFAVPLTLTGYLFYKCRMLVHKSSLFLKG